MRQSSPARDETRYEGVGSIGQGAGMSGVDRREHLGRTRPESYSNSHPTCELGDVWLQLSGVALRHSWRPFHASISQTGRGDWARSSGRNAGVGLPPRGTGTPGRDVATSSRPTWPDALMCGILTLERPWLALVVGALTSPILERFSFRLDIFLRSCCPPLKVPVKLSFRGDVGRAQMCLNSVWVSLQPHISANTPRWATISAAVWTACSRRILQGRRYRRENSAGHSECK